MTGVGNEEAPGREAEKQEKLGQHSAQRKKETEAGLLEE